MKCGDFQVGIRLGIDETQKDFDEVWPLTLREFDSGDGSNDLRCKVSSLGLRRAESDKGILLDLGLGIIVETEPPSRVVSLAYTLLRDE